MKLDADHRLASTDWMVVALPQIVPTEDYEPPWFSNFNMLTKEHFLFDYRGHEVWGYRYRQDATQRFFVALNADGVPVYINEVTEITLAFASSAECVSHHLHRGLRYWTQSSVGFAPGADRAKLKGLATKIFWDYLASPGNVAITDSQQTSAGTTFWKKILAPGVKYIVINVASDYRHNFLRVISGSDRWADASHVAYDVHSSWTESEDGKLMRVAVTQGLR